MLIWAVFIIISNFFLKFIYQSIYNFMNLLSFFFVNSFYEMFIEYKVKGLIASIIVIIHTALGLQVYNAE